MVNIKFIAVEFEGPFTLVEEGNPEFEVQGTLERCIRFLTLFPQVFKGTASIVSVTGEVVAEYTPGE